MAIRTSRRRTRTPGRLLQNSRSRHSRSLSKTSMAFFKYSVALAAAALATMSSANAADRAAREWLERMSESLATRSYDGRYLHVRNSRTETMRIIHRVEKGKV